MNCIYPSTYRRWDVWSQIDKNDYLNAMRESVADSTISRLLYSLHSQLRLTIEKCLYKESIIRIIMHNE